MSGYRKGTRKPKNIAGLKEIAIGGHKIPPALVVAVLLAALYVTFLLGGRLESGSDILVLSALSVLFFAALAYLANGGGLPGLRPFVRLIDAFLALSALTLAWGLAVSLNLAGYGIVGAVAMSMAYAALSIILVGLVLSYEKDRLKNIRVKAGGTAYLAAGAAGAVVCTLLGTGVAYLLHGGTGTDRIVYLLGAAILFSVLSAAYEELWFRGLLLSRLVPLVGEKSALIVQAAVFGVFEAVTLYALSPQALYVPVAFIAASVLGYWWGRMALKDDSLIGTALFHAGFYALIGLPLFAGML